MKNLNAVAVIAAFFTLFSCTDKDDSASPGTNNTTGNNCQVKEITINDTLRYSIMYNQQNKVATVYYIGDDAKVESFTNYAYSGNKVYEISDGDTTTYIIGPNGYASQVTTAGFTTTYEYNSSNQLIKETSTYSITTHTYSGGNKVSTEDRDLTTNTVTGNTTYEYTTKADTRKYQDLNMLTGIGSKNLQSKETYTPVGSTSQVTSYTYPSFDAKGNVLKVVVSFQASTLNMGLTWSCK